MLFGHVAISLLEHRYLKADLAPVVAAGIFPDLVDKTLCQVLHLTPCGRMLGHTLLGLAVSTAAVYLARRDVMYSRRSCVLELIEGRKGRPQRTAWSWALGYLSHLLGDMGWFIPWLYPFVDYDFPGSSASLAAIVRQALQNRTMVGLELGLWAWAIWALCWPKVRISTLQTMRSRGQALSGQ